MLGTFYGSTCSLDELDETSNHIKISKYRILNQKVAR